MYAVLHILFLTAVTFLGYRAAEAVNEMVGLGMQPDVVVYSILLNSYLVSEDVTAAHQVLEDMKAAGVKPNNYTYGSLMAFHSQVGSVSKVQVSHLLPNHMLHCKSLFSVRKAQPLCCRCSGSHQCNVRV